MTIVTQILIDYNQNKIIMVSFSFEADPNTGRIDGFSAGDTVSGLLTINFEQRTIIKGIKATVNGKTRYSFAQRVSKRGFKMTEEHFNCIFYFLCDNENVPDIVAEHKAYEFPILFTLPQGIPGSFKGKLGSVEYSLTVEVMKGLFALNPSKTFPLTVHGVIDLNQFQIPEISKKSFGLEGPEEDALSALYSISNPDAIGFPTKVTTEKRFWKLYDMNLTFTIAKTGFVAGENVHFKATVTNKGSSSINLSFRVLQEIVYIFTNDCDREEEEDYFYVFQYEGPIVGPRETTTWNVSGGEIKMPPLPLTNLGGGNLIGVNYCAQIILKTRGSGELVGSIPIFIGTKALENSEEEPFSHPARLIRSISFGSNDCCSSFSKKALAIVTTLFLTMVFFILKFVVKII